MPVTDEIAGSLFPAACFRDLIGDPFCGWMSCDAKPQNLSSAVPHDQQTIEQAKRNCRHDEHIHRSDPTSVIVQERLPTLRRWFSSFDHILGHARLSDIDAELEQLSVDPRRSAFVLLESPLCRRPSRTSGGIQSRSRSWITGRRQSGVISSVASVIGSLKRRLPALPGFK